MQRQGFSLLELAIVIVVIGLIAGGILIGENLIQAQRLRNMTQEAKTYATMLQQFHDKYGEYPGDFTQAASVWSGAVSGNGNGTIEYGTAANTTAEVFEAWRQLVFAGMVTGQQFTGKAGTMNATDYRFDGTLQNAPKSVFEMTGWMIAYIDASGGGGHMFKVDYTHWIGVGSNQNAGGGASYADDGFLSNTEAQGIDTKIDDGMPAQGHVHAMGLDTGCTDAGSLNGNFSANYALSVNETNACALLFNYSFVKYDK